jgi:glycine/D-amino acid oxidase-like deaminating enzyme
MHSGITLAPLVGELVAAEIGGQPQPLLTPWRPGRFSG